MTTISDHLGCPICETTPWKARVKWRSTCFAHAPRAPGQCAKPSPRQGFTHPSRSIFTHWGDVMPRPACRLHRASDGSPPECAVTAQIAHRKYAAQYARLVRIRVRTSSRFALRFAPSNANLERTQPVVTTLVTTGIYQCERLPGTGFHCGFQGFVVVSTDNLASRAQSPQKAERRIITSRPTHLRHGYSAMLNHHFANGGTSYGLE